MIICKNLDKRDPILTLTEWFSKCPPMGGKKHWVDGRSAKETAKHWLLIIPKEFRDLLRCFNLEYEICAPEYVTFFDSYTGNGRNHDLLILAKNQQEEKVVISIESKVDESFNRSIEKKLEDIKKKKTRSENSNADRRILELKDAFLPLLVDKVFGLLKYQLLVGLAGTLAEAKKQGATKAIFLVQTFISSDMDSIKHRQNQRDLDFFMEVVSNGKHKIVHDNDLFGPFLFPGNEFIPDDIELWIGKYSIKI